MAEIFFSPATTPFAVAIVLMLIIAMVEIVGALMGTSASAALDSMLPDIDVDMDVDFDGDVGGPLDADAPAVPDAPGAGPLSQLLGWLCVGKVPVLVLLIIFLTAFGLAGFVIQGLQMALLGMAIPSFLAAIPAFFAAMPVTRYAGLGFAMMIPKEQTEAVSQKLFIGKVATIVRGIAAKGSPAEAKLKDSFGQSHYILVEPDLDGETFSQADEIVIVRQSGSIYQAIRNTSAAMSDRE
ncbi:YqiJ family protein [Parvularcula flava]|uniref:YqiJ family protein n=1 Tax=Aquisalinus luteolus TaxID=1566827 RepID=A0A8J3A1Y7_9PROT|nr:YqiJ family protein [Aquisalinus luteolus]NHK27011.1 YqiJ family protein [Aquisalinus luteolus]GGH94094.1 hypothetical protein GCM10011355_07470 [Aquisalinus luteolus]